MSILDARDTGESAATRLNEALLRFAPRLSARIQRIAAGIETEGGRVKSTPENLAAIASLVAAMRNDFIDDELVEAITDYVQSFDTISQDILDAFEDFDNFDPEFVAGIDRTFKQQTAGLLLSPDTYERSLWNNVANGMIYAAAVGSPVTDMLQSLDNIVESGAVTQATEGIVESAPLMLQRTATAAVAEQVGAEFFFYQGRPLKTTRDFCREREGRYWHREEIKQWGRDAAAGNVWDGVVEGTNEQTIFLHLGGWYGARNSCRHVLIVVPRIGVPEEDLARMRAKGLID
jgi:predicted transcriptional regulator